MTSASRSDVAHGLWLRNTAQVKVTDLVEYAVAAEEAGWDGVFLSDSITWGYTEPWTILAGIATRTDQLQLGTWITPIPRRQPWQLAHELATLDQLSDGRVILGGGLGTPSEHDTFGPPSAARNLGEKYDEALQIIDGLWAGDAFSFDGDHYSVNELELAQSPEQDPRIPILLGGWWPNKKPFRRAARWDGVMPNWPAMTEAGEGPQGEEATGSVEEELRDLLEYYHGLTDDPGDIQLPLEPANASEDYGDICRELGVTWFLDTNTFEPGEYQQNLEHIRKGPPS